MHSALADLPWIVVKPGSVPMASLDDWTHDAIVEKVGRRELSAALVLYNRVNIFERRDGELQLLLYITLERSTRDGLEPLHVFIREEGPLSQRPLLFASIAVELLRRLRYHHELGLSPREKSSVIRQLLSQVDRHLRTTGSVDESLSRQIDELAERPTIDAAAFSSLLADLRRDSADGEAPGDAAAQGRDRLQRLGWQLLPGGGS